jgi:hypothetical protein
MYIIGIDRASYLCQYDNDGDLATNSIISNDHIGKKKKKKMKIAVIDDSNNIVSKYQRITCGDYSRRQISTDDCLAARFAFYRFIKDLSTTYLNEEGIYIRYKGIATLYGTSDDDDDDNNDDDVAAAHLYSKDNSIYPIIVIYPTNATIAFLTTMRQALQQLPHHHHHHHHRCHHNEENESIIVLPPKEGGRVSSVMMHR